MRVMLSAALVGLVLSGCATKAAPGRAAGFVEAKRMRSPADLPFRKAWVSPAVDWTNFTEIAFAEVNTDLLPTMDWWKALERRGRFEADARKLAQYAKKTFERVFRNDPNERFRVVEAPGPQTLVVEVALVEVIPSKVVLNTLGYVPFVGSAFRFIRTTKGRSTVAFEARVRDGATGEIIATFADREAEKYTPVNVKDVTWYGHAESIIAEWADQAVRAANKRRGEAVKNSKPWHLKPW